MVRDNVFGVKMESKKEVFSGSKTAKRVAAVSRGITSLSKPGTGFGLPAISPTRGIIQGSRIITMESRKVSRRRARKPNQKEYDDLLQAFNQTKVEIHDLQNQNIRLQTLVLESKNELALRTQQYKELYERYEMLSHLEKWGEVIRNKDREIQRLQDEIKKMSTDRNEALNEKVSAEEMINGLKSKLRGKKREINDMKAAEKVINKAKVLSETETLRNERDIALGRLSQRDTLIEELRQRIRSIEQELYQRKLSIQELQRRTSVKEKQVDDLRRSSVISKFRYGALANH
ncbi:kinesin-related protein 4-like [Actinia tenebrosa]|uniref:Kinesin-related protein 4-like n=1 Tax=Actinia tenebrosa TaxID=6105 RepID=A0A6P8I4F3_ACTTE|nr:kinesin-related protein 4-like [Actinia tenebrosa]